MTEAELNGRKLSLVVAYFTAANLSRLIDARRLFPGDVHDERATAAFRVFVDHLEHALSSPDLEAVRAEYERPHIENTSAPGVLFMIRTVAIMWLANHCGIQSDQLAKIPSVLKEKYESLDEDLRNHAKWLEEELIFNCRVPHPNDDATYKSPQRSICMLGRYLNLYRTILQDHGTSEVFYSPHPLLRFIENLRIRIRHYLDVVAELELHEAASRMLDIPLDWDSNAVWDDYGQPILAEVSERFEQLRTERRVLSEIELTEAEKLFIDQAESAIESCRKRIKQQWKSILNSAEKIRQQNAPQKDRPLTCFEYVGRVECRLRELIQEEYQARFGADWTNQISKSFDNNQMQAIETTMKQRKIDSRQELLHFTQLVDVFKVISQRWDLFAHRIACSRKEFNNLLSPILKGRTEEAHNRPEHIWPQIEKDRVRVACHDLLSKLLQETNTSTKQESE
jgi:hypothetical protein